MRAHVPEQASSTSAPARRGGPPDWRVRRRACSAPRSCDAQRSRPRPHGPAPGAHLDVEVGERPRQATRKHSPSRPYQFARVSDVRLGHALERLQRRRGVAAHGAQHRRRLDAAHAAGIGHRDALDVLDDIARAPHSELLGFATEHQARQRRRIRQRDRLLCNQSADELAVQQLAQGKGRAPQPSFRTRSAPPRGPPHPYFQRTQCSEPKAARATPKPPPPGLLSKSEKRGRFGPAMKTRITRNGRRFHPTVKSARSRRLKT